MNFESVPIDADKFLTESTLVAAVLVFVLVVLLVVMLVCLTLRLLRCGQDFCNRGVHRPSNSVVDRRPADIHTIHVRHISVVHTPAEEQASSEEAVRRRTPPPRYSEVTDTLPSYGTATRGMDGAVGRGGQQPNHNSSPDSVFFSGTLGEDSQDHKVPYLRMVPPTPSDASPRVSQ
ncbi:uncharacterized protein LOC126981450 [Eriocheir sinensis]|uniref:uncharacterized protein LOC126981450 n=1 Tax=Eriocheir sinensis TaxID=95602 RepID=UPI0021C91997|nr:uncharacterized protein LOC126981450 [Eriocheir sinensis]